MIEAHEFVESRVGWNGWRNSNPQESLPDVFVRLVEVCDGIAAPADGVLRERVMQLLRAWTEWSTFPPQFTKGLEATLRAAHDLGGAGGGRENRVIRELHRCSSLRLLEVARANFVTSATAQTLLDTCPMNCLSNTACAPIRANKVQLTMVSRMHASAVGGSTANRTKRRTGP